MRKIVLLTSVAIVTLGTIGISRAECTTEEMICGEHCCATLDNGILTISGSGTMYNYSSACNDARAAAECNGNGNPPPWENYYDDIRVIKFSETSSITNIGNKAFIRAINLTELDIPDSIESIGYKSFKYADLNSISMPDTITGVGHQSLGYNSDQLSNLNIICKGDVTKCQSLFKKYSYSSDHDIIDLSGNVIAATYEQCDGQYFWNGISCVREPDISKRACCPVCADLDGYCSRIRYTLPEADAATSDDNENMIEWIFE
ncbi:MAG: leucine-rich repeat protein [Alphaproteobacteria bacterium]|nr:leucine-rich repeat protein [Alphaproteobacteria bacterium]